MALDNPTIVNNKIKEELMTKRIAGPFASPPFQNFKSSPLSLREKSVLGTYRLLHNLSYPYDEKSVNINIPRECASVQYANITHAIKLIQQHGPGAYLAKSDIQNAFRLIPLHPSQYHLTGFQWDGYYYYDRCLPQGCASSCRIFERFSDAIKWILAKHCDASNVVKILDDFLFVSSLRKCSTHLKTFQSLCQELGVPLAAHKTLGPSQTLTFVGIELDTIAMEARLPQEKLTKYTHDLREFIQHDKVTLDHLQSMVGKLQFATSVIRPGRAFLRRMYDLTKRVQKPHHFLRLNREVKSDLEMWLQFLSNFNGTTIIRTPSFADSDTLHMFSDASKQGFGATFGTHWIHGPWPKDWASQDITLLEFYPIFLLVHIFANKLRNSRIIFHCDNVAVTYIINNQTSKHPTIMQLVRPFVLTLLQYNITCKSEHIFGVNNVLCDRISRMQVTPSLLVEYGMQPSPTDIPTHLLPQNYTLQPHVF